jgi:toxin-antitoxin system PIN domain toxin
VSVTLDVNVLVHATNSASNRQRAALDTMRSHLNGDGIVYLFWPVLLGFFHIATHPGIFTEPLDPNEATDFIDRTVRRPNVRTPGENPDFWPTLKEVAAEVPLRGRLVPDAHIVALMRQYGVRTIITHDRDFRKFDGVRVVDPFAD